MGLGAIAAVGTSPSAYWRARIPVTVAGYYGTAALPRVFGRIAHRLRAGRPARAVFSAGAIYDADQHYGTAVILIAVRSPSWARLFYAGLPRRERLGASAKRAA